MSQSHNGALDNALSALSALHPKKIDLGLGRIERVLKKLGNPHLYLPPIVHIAGTNGKGSTLSYIRAMAEAQGLKCHVYISPHLMRFNERITLASKEIDDTTLIDVLRRVREANAGEALSFFEATTAAMFLAFSECSADLVLLEVGLGGKYDATNVIIPTLSVITPIDYDHAEFLGKDLAGIAREKAGIMKRHTSCIIGRQTELVDAVLDAEGNKLGIKPKFLGQDYRSYIERGRLVYEDEKALLDLPLPALAGLHQIDNAAVAIAAARALQISDKAIEKGLQTVNWPARMQNLTTGDYAKTSLAQKVIDRDGELWLDGGHNAHAAKAVSNHIADLESRDPKPLILIIAMVENKDRETYLSYFAGLAKALVAVDIPDHNSASREDLIALAKKNNMAGDKADSLSEAIDKALGQSDEPVRILICGSLYLAGRVLAHA